MNRRRFTLISSLTLATGSVLKAAEAEQAEVLSLGLLTDVHYADKKTQGTRAYRDSLLKGKEAAEFFKSKNPASIRSPRQTIAAGFFDLKNSAASLPFRRLDRKSVV